jgi:hypothetical protein
VVIVPSISTLSFPSQISQLWHSVHHHQLFPTDPHSFAEMVAGELNDFLFKFFCVILEIVRKKLFLPLLFASAPLFCLKIGSNYN